MSDDKHNDSHKYVCPPDCDPVGFALLTDEQKAMAMILQGDASPPSTIGFDEKAYDVKNYLKKLLEKRMLRMPEPLNLTKAKVLFRNKNDRRYWKNVDTTDPLLKEKKRLDGELYNLIIDLEEMQKQLNSKIPLPEEMPSSAQLLKLAELSHVGKPTKNRRYTPYVNQLFKAAATKHSDEHIAHVTGLAAPTSRKRKSYVSGLLNEGYKYHKSDNSKIGHVQDKPINVDVGHAPDPDPANDSKHDNHDDHDDGDDTETHDTDTDADNDGDGSVSGPVSELKPPIEYPVQAPAGPGQPEEPNQDTGEPQQPEEPNQEAGEPHQPEEPIQEPGAPNPPSIQASRSIQFWGEKNIRNVVAKIKSSTHSGSYSASNESDTAPVPMETDGGEDNTNYDYSDEGAPTRCAA